MKHHPHTLILVWGNLFICLSAGSAIGLCLPIVILRWERSSPLCTYSAHTYEIDWEPISNGDMLQGCLHNGHVDGCISTWTLHNIWQSLLFYAVLPILLGLALVWDIHRSLTKLSVVTSGYTLPGCLAMWDAYWDIVSVAVMWWDHGEWGWE